nr:immunoglobulin heavy chain junction region [Mus musculus]MBK4188516.1 immunoglobulin heavy chain junction region [Mus musculus]
CARTTNWDEGNYW